MVLTRMICEIVVVRFSVAPVHLNLYRSASAFS